MAGWIRLLPLPRGQQPTSTGKVPFTSFDKILAFDAFGTLETLLTQPILLIADSEAGTRWQSEEAFKHAVDPKELFIVDGTNHFNMYDIPKYIDQAEVKLVEFFGKIFEDRFMCID